MRPKSCHVAALVALLVGTVLAAGCVTVRARTEAIVDVDAEDSIRDDIDALLVTVRGGPSAGELDTMLTDVLTEPDYPVRVTVLPRDEDATRRFEVVVIARGAGGRIIGRQSARGRFLPGQRTHLSLLLESCCVDVASMCSSDESCEACECVPIVEVDPMQDAGVPSEDDAGVDAFVVPDGGSDAGPVLCAASSECPVRDCEEATCNSDGTCSYRPLCAGGSVCCQGVCAPNCDCLERRRDEVCRAQRGECDVPETCDGRSSVCPSDAVAGPAIECRPSTGSCDVPDRCDGFSRDCTPDEHAPLGTTCATGSCDGLGTCVSGCPDGAPCATGNPCQAGAIRCDTGTPVCMPSGAAPASTVCRPVAGPCDVAETCGGATTCPPDAFLGTSTVCRVAAGPCDVTEVCSGDSAACPADLRAATSSTCRASAGPCDLAETCAAGSVDCPADGFASSGVCRAANGMCDVAESCDGTAAMCPADRFAPSTTVCGTALTPCYATPTCSGVSNLCLDAEPANEGMPCGGCEAVCRSGVCAPDCSGMTLCCESLGRCVLTREFPTECPLS
jgi:hypothetical protein